MVGVGGWGRGLVGLEGGAGGVTVEWWWGGAGVWEGGSSGAVVMRVLWWQCLLEHVVISTAIDLSSLT